MANFNTHFNVAAVTTGLTASLLLAAEHIDTNSALALWFLGTIGGLLPDMDADNSTSLDIIFNLFSFCAVFLSLHYITAEDFQQISLIELVAVPLLVYAIVRWGVRPIFEKITVHRGSCHSLLFILWISLVTTQVVWRLSPQTPEDSAMIAWLAGGFVFLGSFIHLLLDEIYSVDLSNVRIKRSFGSALKLADFDNKIITLLTIVSIIMLFYSAPAIDDTISALSNWSKLKLIPSF